MLIFLRVCAVISSERIPIAQIADALSSGLELCDITAVLTRAVRSPPECRYTYRYIQAFVMALPFDLIVAALYSITEDFEKITIKIEIVYTFLIWVLPIAQLST